jgi:hypothetical protein
LLNSDAVRILILQVVNCFTATTADAHRYILTDEKFLFRFAGIKLQRLGFIRG